MNRTVALGLMLAPMIMAPAPVGERFPPSLGAQQERSAATPLTLDPCHLPDIDEELRCGTYEVWETRAARSGRRIPLRVVMLPAHGSDPEPEPLVILEGGPGASNVGSAGFFVASPLRDRWSILLIDTRGTGSSAPLDCGFQAGQRLGFLKNFLPVEQVRVCRDSLAQVADLAQYVTPNVVDDLDEVRAALGIARVNLWGASGGTRQALVWMRRHPSRIRSAILEGPVPIDARMPLSFAADAQAALEWRAQRVPGRLRMRSALPERPGRVRCGGATIGE